MPQHADLTALISARICHDLISPIGAIGNGVELLQLQSGQTSPEIALIAHSVAQASARIRLFRLAFGEARPGQQLSVSDVRDILHDLQAGGRLTFDWQHTPALTRPAGKLVLLMVMCLETALPHGGKVIIAAREQGLRVSGLSPKTHIDEGLWNVLSECRTPPDITPAHVHFSLLAEEMTRQNRRATITFPPGEIVFDF